MRTRAIFIFCLFAVSTVQASTVEDLQPIDQGDLAPLFQVTDPTLHTVAHAVNDGLGREIVHAPHEERDEACAAINYQSDFGSDCDAPATCTALNAADPSRTRFMLGVGQDRFDPADTHVTLTDDAGIEDTQDAGFLYTGTAPTGSTVNLQYFGPEVAAPDQAARPQRVSITISTADCQYTDLQNPQSTYYQENKPSLAPPAEHPDWVLYEADLDLACPDEHGGQNRVLINQKKELDYVGLGPALFVFADMSTIQIDPTRENKAVSEWATSENWHTSLAAVYTYAPPGHENHFMLVEGNCDAEADAEPLAGTDAPENFAWFTPLSEGPFVVQVTLVEGPVPSDAPLAGADLFSTVTDLFRPQTMSCDTDMCTVDGAPDGKGLLKAFAGPSIPLTR